MIQLENLTKIFETPQGTAVAADHINMRVGEGEICVLLGPSGCGKTTTLKMINRLITPTSGKIIIDGKDTSDYDVVTLRRNIGYVIQQIGLFPNMTIADNIAIVPKMLGWEADKMQRRAEELLDLVGLDPRVFMKRFPAELSGGQQQRVGVIRALAANPPVMLMDEPFGAIDPINREVIQDEFLKMQRELKKTIMFVSHDIDEAVKMADRIAIFKDGKIAQYDSPDNILAHPANKFVADFVGDDRTLKRLGLVTAADAMRENFPTVTRDDELTKARQLMDKFDHLLVYLVNSEGRPIGYVDRGRAARDRGLCGDHYQGLPDLVHQHDNLRSVVSRMFKNDAECLPVVDDQGHLVGEITQSDITHLLGATYRNKE